MRASLLIFAILLLLPIPLDADELNENLLQSIRKENTERVRSLIEAGADVNTLSEQGETALMRARQGGNAEIVDLLKQAGAKELFAVHIGKPLEGDELPWRSAMEVQDAFSTYTPEEWIVSPVEEPRGDIAAGTIPRECDIEGVLSCFDAKYLRVDILLHHEATSDRTVGFGVKLTYGSDIDEYFTYFPGLERLYYVREESGEVKKSQRLMGDRIKDSAGSDARDVYIVIDKDAHIAGEKGKLYYVMATFYSTTLDRELVGTIEDRTITVNLQYKR